MGALGSKEKLGQIVAIYGYNENNFRWMPNSGRSVYHTSGLIIEHNNKKYIVTTRAKLISCKNIVMYHSYFIDSDTVPVMRNDLQILFQYIDFNIIILGTKNYNELNLDVSEILFGNYNPKIVSPSYNIMKNIFVTPTKRSHYHVARMSMNLESDTIQYNVHIHDVKFNKSVVYDKTFLPESYMYKFNLKNNESSLEESMIIPQGELSVPKTGVLQEESSEINLDGICGAIVFNKKHQLVGLISKTEKSKKEGLHNNKLKIYVIPTKIIIKIVIDFVKNLDKPDEYHGLMTLPLNLKISKTNTIKIDHNVVINTIECKKTLKINDDLISINGNPINNDNDCISVFDEDLNENIPFDIYTKLNGIDYVNLVLRRNKKLIDIDVLNNLYHVTNLPLTNLTYFHPLDPIPYINISGIIVVQLTHELLDLTMSNGIALKNKIINDIFEDLSELPNSVLLIIDCLSSVLAGTYKLPQIILNPIINCPIITTINGIDVFTLDNIKQVLQNNKSSVKIIAKNVDDNLFEIVC